jgi:YVTN family beta-propeller protein
VRIDPRRNEVGQTIELAAFSLTGLAVGAGSVWATDLEAGLLWRIEPGPDPTTRTIDVGFGVTAVAYGAGAAWVGNWHDNSVSRIDPATNRVVGSPIPIGSHHAGNLAVGAGDLWVTSDYRANAAAEDVVVVRIDPATNRAAETIAVGGHPIDVAATAGAVWVSVANPGTLLRIVGR